MSLNTRASLFLADEDEDGDRITVRSDEEMKAMLSYVSRPYNRLGWDFDPNPQQMYFAHERVFNLDGRIIKLR